jgi:hypothetical protein
VGDALAVIDAVFTDKMRANAEDDRLGRQRQPFAEFVFDFFLQRYPTTATANAALVSLLLKLNESLPVSRAPARASRRCDSRHRATQRPELPNRLRWMALFCGLMPTFGTSLVVEVGAAPRRAERGECDSRAVADGEQ